MNVHDSYFNAGRYYLNGESRTDDRKSFRKKLRTGTKVTNHANTQTYIQVLTLQNGSLTPYLNFIYIFVSERRFNLNTETRFVYTNTI